MHISIHIKGNKNVGGYLCSITGMQAYKIKYFKTYCYIVKQGGFNKKKSRFISLQYYLYIFHMPNIVLNILLYNNLEIDIWCGKFNVVRKRNSF